MLASGVRSEIHGEKHGEIRGTVDELLGIDPASCSSPELERVVELSARVRGWVDAVDVAVARRVAQSVTSAAQPSPAEVLGRCGRRSRKDAKAAADRAVVCDQLPEFEAALASGAVSAGHVDALANAIRHLDDAARSELHSMEHDLLASAVRDTVAAFEKDCRDLARLLSSDGGVSDLDRQKANATVRRWIDKTNGMWHLHAELDAETGASVWTAIDAQLASIRQRDGNREVPMERLSVAALAELLGAAPDGDGRPVPEVCIHVDWQTLVDGLHAVGICETADGTPLPVDTVRRLCCEATIVPVVLNGDGAVLAVGREQRVANRAQRRALRAMYRTCAHPHCDVPFDHCQIHHVIPWERFGATDLENLLPLCTAHHHQVHEGRWQLTLVADRTITLHRPDGSHYFTGRTIDRTGRRTDRHPLRGGRRSTAA